MERSEFFAELEKYPKVRGDDYYNVPLVFIILFIFQSFVKAPSFPLAPSTEIIPTQENLLHNQFQNIVPIENLDNFVSKVIQVLLLFIIQNIE